MNLKRNKSYTAEVYTGSLNDIMFFLFFFFLIVSTLVNPSVVKIFLPRTTTSQTISKQQYALYVTKDRNYILRYYSEAERKNIVKEIDYANLDAEIVASVKDVKDPTIVLRMDNSLTVQDIVDVLQVGAKNQIRMVLATQLNKNTATITK
jgi:biopolymer transport protein ExbD